MVNSFLCRNRSKNTNKKGVKTMKKLSLLVALALLITVGGVTQECEAGTYTFEELAND